MSYDTTIREMTSARFIADAAEFYGLDFSPVEVQRRFHALVVQDGNPDAVELVMLRRLQYRRSGFALEELGPVVYDNVRREVVEYLPSDTPEAWNYALWTEQMFYVNTDLFSRAEKALGRWTDAAKANDSAEADRARRQLAALAMTHDELKGLSL